MQFKPVAAATQRHTANAPLSPPERSQRTLEGKICARIPCAQSLADYDGARGSHSLAPACPDSPTGVRWDGKNISLTSPSFSYYRSITNVLSQSTVSNVRQTATDLRAGYTAHAPSSAHTTHSTTERTAAQPAAGQNHRSYGTQQALPSSSPTQTCRQRTAARSPPIELDPTGDSSWLNNTSRHRQPFHPRPRGAFSSLFLQNSPVNSRKFSSRCRPKAIERNKLVLFSI